MGIENLPIGTNPKAIDFLHFPTKFQSFIWRNWTLVDVNKMALILNTSEDNILHIASGLGLDVPPVVNKKWLARGYVTLIRNNWHILNYEQLLQLLQWSPEKMDFVLREEDFLFGKLGYLKPYCEKLEYRALTVKEQEQTEIVKQNIKNHFPDNSNYVSQAFDFLDFWKDSVNDNNISEFADNSPFKLRLLYSYSAIYGDSLYYPELDPYPENLLAEYARQGINGIWLQVILYTLYPMEKSPDYSIGYEKRLKSLNDIVKKAAKYGIKVYLYLNEPRGMPVEFFDKYPDWKGAQCDFKDSIYALCTSQKEVLNYIEDACGFVFKNVPGLAGVITITVSENITNCHSRFQSHKCPICSKREIHEVVAEVNNVIAKGIHKVNPNANVITWTWAWKEEWKYKTLELLSEDIEVMSVSEWGKKVKFGEIESPVYEYSISCPGSSEETIKGWEIAKKRGLNTIAKVQLNNSWECAAVPYIPVPYLIKEHLDNLLLTGVNGLVISWTLGGYPGGNLELIFKTPAEIAVEKFGNNALTSVSAAWRMFCDAFKEFPFNQCVLYRGPQNFGPMNLLYEKPTGYNSSTVGFPYDDIKVWKGIYSEDIFESQLLKLSEKWKQGLDILLSAEKEIDKDKIHNYKDLKSVSLASWCHFRSSYLQFRYNRIRANNDIISLDEILKILTEEIEVAKILHLIVREDSRIGFEATNHYAYTLNDLKEKVLNCEFLKETFIKKRAEILKSANVV